MRGAGGEKALNGAARRELEEGEECWARAAGLHWRAISSKTETGAREGHVHPRGGPSAVTLYPTCTPQSVRELLSTRWEPGIPCAPIRDSGLFYFEEKKTNSN